MASAALSLGRVVALASLVCCLARAADAPVTSAWQQTHDRLVGRLSALESKEGLFGGAYRPLFHAALPWYARWGGRNPNPVDVDMVAPEIYAAELAESLEQGRNYFAENPAALFPLAFRRVTPDGQTFEANYWLNLPAGFPAPGSTYPLVIGLHGSGWMAHKISFKRGSGGSGPTFAVVPIDMAGPWKIDFLNAFFAELMAILPVDANRVYLEGHSLGGMATWEWALSNPEHFAAISPEAGIGEPYRAARLRNIPAWAIHGEMDDVVPNGYADQMVSALQAVGAPVRYTLIKGGGHNMPADLDRKQILEWYLRQTRSALPVPPDPRDALGLNGDGFSKSELVSRPATPAWNTGPVDVLKQETLWKAASGLFQKAHDRRDWVDAPVRAQMDPATHLATLWLAVPAELHASGPSDPSVTTLPAARFYRFYFRGEANRALEHAASERALLSAAGHATTGDLWITDLAIWHNRTESVGECWIGTP